MSFLKNMRSFFGFDEVQEVNRVAVKRNVVLPQTKAQVKEKIISQDVVKTFQRKEQPHNAMGIVVFEPRNYEQDQQTISSYLKDGYVVIINLKYLDAPSGRRLIDFICGTTYAFEGLVKPLGGNIFLCTPGSVTIFDEQQDGVIFNDQNQKEQYTPENAYQQEFLYRGIS